MAKKPKMDLDERHAIPIDAEEAIRALLKVDSEALPALTDKEAELIVKRALADEDKGEAHPPGHVRKEPVCGREPWGGLGGQWTNQANLGSPGGPRHPHPQNRPMRYRLGKPGT